MSYKRKTIDVWDLWGFYACGWEILTSELSAKAIGDRRADYRANEPGLRMKITCKRERIEAQGVAA